jgi:D-sedoheptulose 7-phosphate isomerase
MKRAYIELDILLRKYPVLQGMNLESSLHAAVDLLTDSFIRGGKLLVCGNGGSAADADHIVSELMKNFLRRRTLRHDLQQRLIAEDDERASKLAASLQGALPAINLSAHTALLTAFCNDADGDYVFAQQVGAYGREGDSLLAISTSGDSENVVNAAALAYYMQLTVIGLTGSRQCALAEYCNVLIAVHADSTPGAQELQLPIYHALCAEVERRVWNAE